MPGSSSPAGTSAAPQAPRQTLTGVPLSSSMRNQGLTGLFPARPATATGVGSTGGWVMELGDGGVSQARVLNNKAAAAGPTSGLTPTQQQQQQLLDIQRNSSSGGSSNVAGSHAPRTAWDTSGSSLRPSLGMAHASINLEDQPPSSYIIGSPHTLSSSAAAAAAAAAAAEGPSHYVGTNAGRTMPTSAAASPSRLGSSSSIPLPGAFESSRS
eukprot:scaffold51496_cov17-Tisochrysis_lutea.AAC.4